MIKEYNRLYVAYGSNLNLAQMAYRCPGATVVGASKLTDYRLLFRGSHGYGVATVEPCTGHSVPVLLWDITREHEKELDRYEGFPFLYRKEDIEVVLDGQPVSAMVYIMNTNEGTRGEFMGLPSNRYFSTIAEGYASAGFNLDVLKEAEEYSGTGQNK